MAPFDLPLPTQRLADKAPACTAPFRGPSVWLATIHAPRKPKRPAERQCPHRATGLAPGRAMVARDASEARRVAPTRLRASWAFRTGLESPEEARGNEGGARTRVMGCQCLLRPMRPNERSHHAA
jgi:hypothetical protein